MQKFFWSLRSLLFVVWMAVTVIPWGCMCLVASLFMRGTPLYRLTMYWLRIAVAGARVICGVRWRIAGQENIDAAERAGATVVLSKHQSTWEAFALPQLMPRPLCYVFKRELLMIPFFGWAMSRLDMVHIDRSKRNAAWAKVAAQGRQFMAQGSWVIMFPEGTRAPRGQQLPYKSGGTRLAVATGAVVLPIAVSAARCWPRKSFMLRPGVVDISVGKPIASVGRESEELMREVETWIEAEMRRIDPDAYMAPGHPGHEAAGVP